MSDSEQICGCPMCLGAKPLLTSGDPLFDHMSDEHGLTLLNSELHEIRLICRRMDAAEQEPVVDAQRAALAEARRRIIARFEHVETWLKQPVSDGIIANWGGIVEGLRQARMIVGAMWDNLPITKTLTEEDAILGQDTIP